MDRTQLLLIGLPIFLFCTDIVGLFTPTPPKPSHHGHHQPHHQSKSQQRLLQEPLPFPTQNQKNSISNIGGIGLGNTVNIDFCTSCSYRGNAVTIKNMLEAEFPGINVVLANHPPAFPKHLVSKVVPVVQVGVIGVIMAGEQIFPRLGIMTPPPWYYSLRANRFGSIASIWLFGNFLQSSLQSTGAFEVYCNGALVFSKLKEQRFPGEIELRELLGQRLGISRTVSAL
ncbi:Selenoprotein T [Parasponia andersonii]|uniref:Selenoprotein T n=1 Tax=Parasponia andersonii TaxID=3476 RepID=A0A2P5BQS2_PARAD|nr:Selenoprotein T [Parasponia andersonii]